MQCRNELEELGLISWSEVNGCVEIGMSAPSEHSERLVILSAQSITADCLFNLSLQYTQEDARLEKWIEVYSLFPLNESTELLMRFEKAVRSFGTFSAVDHLKNLEENAGMIVTFCSSLGLCDYSMMVVHCVIAKLIEMLSGPTARKSYLNLVSQSFPRLLTDPTVTILQRRTSNCR